MKRLRIVGAAVVLLLAAFLTWRLQQDVKPEAPVPTGQGYLEWTAPSLKAGMKQKHFTLINVHIPFEGRIAGTDLEIPYDQIDQALGRLPQAKDAPIVLYCRSGRMSEIAAQRLVALGYTRVINIKGGMLAWEQAGYPLQTE